MNTDERLRTLKENRLVKEKTAVSIAYNELYEIYKAIVDLEGKRRKISNYKSDSNFKKHDDVVKRIKNYMDLAKQIVNDVLYANGRTKLKATPLYKDIVSDKHYLHVAT